LLQYVPHATFATTVLADWNPLNAPVRLLFPNMLDAVVPDEDVPVNDPELKSDMS